MDMRHRLARPHHDGGETVNWKVVGLVLLYLFLAYSIPQLRPAYILHSLATFGQTMSALNG